MKPLNESSKRDAIKKFAWIYGLSLLAILLTSFFLFSSPVKIFKEEARNYSEFKSNYSALLKKTAMINTQVNELLAVKQAINSNPSPGLDSMARKYIDNINKQVTSLRNDSANSILKPYKNDMANYLSAYNAVLYYSVNDIENRNVTSAIPKNEPGAANDNQLRVEIAKLKNENLRLTGENNQLKSSKPSIPSPNEDVRVIQAKLTQAEKDKDACASQLLKGAEDLKTKDGIIKEREDQIAKLNSSVKNNNPQKLTDEEKAQLLFNNVDLVVQKARAQKIGIYTGLIAILKSIQNTYPEKTKIDSKIKEIQRLIPGDW